MNAYEQFDLEVLRRARRYQRWVISTLAIPDRADVLEVGAGIGNFTRWIAGGARSVTAVEPDTRLCRRIEGLGISSVRVASVRIEEFPVDQGRFDCAVLINVLEHVGEERETLEKVRDLLRPRGSLHVLVPAHGVLFGSLDMKYRHLRRYTAADVERLISQSGFSARLCRYFNPLGALGWYLVGRVARHTSLSPGLVRMNEAVVTPLGMALEKILHLPFGQSVAAVATKRD